MLPNMTEALGDLGQSISFNIMGKAAVDFELAEKVNAPTTFNGILVPMDPTALKIKPEGQRSWQWWTMYTTQVLSLDWIVVDTSGRQFRVLAKSDWNSSGAGFLQYDLRQGPTT